MKIKSLAAAISVEYLSNLNDEENFPDIAYCLLAAFAKNIYAVFLFGMIQICTAHIKKTVLSGPVNTTFAKSLNTRTPEKLVHIFPVEPNNWK